MVYHKIEYNGIYYAGKGGNPKFAQSDAHVRVVVDIIDKYAQEKSVYPTFNDLPQKVQSFVKSIYCSHLKKHMSGNQETVELSFSYNRATYLGTGSSATQAKFNACLNAAKAKEASRVRREVNQNSSTSASNMTDFLTSYPDYNSYESFEQNQATKRLPHPKFILTGVLKVKPIFSKIQISGNTFEYYTQVKTKRYKGDSNVKDRGTYESALLAVLDVCKDPGKVAKFNRYMATLNDSKAEAE